MQLQTDHLGFVWGVKGDDILIQLRVGGKLRAKNTGGFDTGDRVAIIFDAAGKVTEVVSQEMAHHAVRIGSEPLYVVATYDRCEETDIFNIEEDNYGYTSSEDVVGIC